MFLMKSKNALMGPAAPFLRSPGARAFVRSREKLGLPESILPQVLVNLVSCKIGSLGHFCTSIKTIMGYMFAFRVNPSGSEIYEMRGWWTGGGGEHVRGSEKPSAGADKRSYYRKQSEELFPNIHRPTEEYAKRGSKKGYF